MNLTSEEIDKLEAGREINDLIAHYIMDWDLDKFQGIETWSNHDSSMTMPVIAWNPSVKIDQAWKVVEKIKSNDSIEPFVLSFNRAWECGFFSGGYEDSSGWKVEALTAPLAICKAALLTVKKKQNEN